MYDKAYLDSIYAITRVINTLADREPVRDRLLQTEICSTNIALIKHYEAYQGDGDLNRFLHLTPAAQRYAVMGLCMLRRIAAAEANDTWAWQADETLTGDEAADFVIRSREASGWDNFLYALAVDANGASLKPPFTEHEDENI